MSNLSKNEPMPTCPVRQLRKVYNKTLMMEDSAPITLEFLLTACFPTVWENINKAMNDMYTRGYIQGKKEVMDESQGYNG